MRNCHHQVADIRILQPGAAAAATAAPVYDILNRKRQSVGKIFYAKFIYNAEGEVCCEDGGFSFIIQFIDAPCPVLTQPG